MRRDSIFRGASITKPLTAALAMLLVECWGFRGGGDTSLRQPWNVVGRYGWDGGTGTAAYVEPQHATVSVVLTQVELGGPDSAGVLETFWAAAAPWRAAALRGHGWKTTFTMPSSFF